MSPLLAVLDFTDFAIIAFSIVVFGGTASLATRQQVNLRRVEGKLDALLQHHGIQPPSDLSPEVRRLASDPRQKIAAIKLYREQTGASLAEAKAAIETISSS
jgi:hypothetical protein